MTRDAETHRHTYTSARTQTHTCKHTKRDSGVAMTRNSKHKHNHTHTHAQTLPSGRMNMKSMLRALGHSLVRSLVRSRRSLIRYFCTARFARGLHCAHSLASELMGKILVYETRRFHTILTHYMGGGRRFAGEGLTGGDGRI